MSILPLSVSQLRMNSLLKRHATLPSTGIASSFPKNFNVRHLEKNSGCTLLETHHHYGPVPLDRKHLPIINQLFHVMLSACLPRSWTLHLFGYCPVAWYRNSPSKRKRPSFGLVYKNAGHAGMITSTVFTFYVSERHQY